jgi:hypothetical protein
VGAGPQDDILAVEARQFGNPQTGLDRDQQEGPIATPYPGGRIGNGAQRLDLFPVEKLNRPPFVAFIGYRHDPLAMQGMSGFL